jgi:hypothetical protein
MVFFYNNIFNSNFISSQLHPFQKFLATSSTPFYKYASISINSTKLEGYLQSTLEYFNQFFVTKIIFYNYLIINTSLD